MVGVVAHAHGENLSADNGEAGITLAGLAVQPEARRAAGGPLLQESRLFGNAPAIGPELLGPIEGLGQLQIPTQGCEE